jgi:RNA polymerase sigma-70 factor (ECF subfamily)
MITSVKRFMIEAEPSADVVDAGRSVLVGLLARVAERDQLALHRLYQLTSPKLNGVIIAILRDAALAEEVLQDTYMNVWRQASTFDPTLSSPVTWLAAIARNRAIDRLRAERRHRDKVEPIEDCALPDETMPALDRLIAGDQRAALLRCLAGLEPDQERPIRAAFFQGHTYEELAAREGVPLSTMKSRIRRGLLRLRSCMGEP